MNNHAVAGQDRTFAYDGAGRLVTATGPWGTGSFEYDSLGNLRRKTLGTRVVDLEYDDIVAGAGTGRLLMARDTADGSVWRNYVHDERGNVTDNDRLTFTYDWANQPASVSGAASGSFRYDGNLKRVKQIVNGETTYSVYGQSGALLFRRNVTTGVITDYIRVAGETVARTKNGVVSYLHQDHLGSPVAATDLAGAIEWREDYTPFGEERQDPAANDNDENFTGHVRDDALGLIYAQARYMDPVIGRFLSGDPVGFSDDLPQMFNRYSYVHNDPINMVDPDGRDAEFTIDEENKTIQIDVPVVFSGTGNTQENRDAITSSIESTFSGTIDEGQYEGYTVTTTVQEVDRLEDGVNSINIVEGTGTSSVGSNRFGTFYTDDAAGNSFSLVSAHESGHFLGLSDRYEAYRAPGGYIDYRPQLGYRGNIMALDGRRVRGSQYEESIRSRATTVRRK